MIKNICVFASSSNNINLKFYNDAKILGQLIGQAGMNIVYGGSRLGMMYACAKAVKDNGGKIFGVMPKRLCDYGVANPDDCDEFFLTEGMRERKAKMDQISDAVVAIPGGFGTLEEISEMIVQKQLGYNNKPIVLLNTERFYDNLIAFFDTVIEKNFAKDSARDLYFIANNPNEVIDYLLSYNPLNVKFASKF